MITQITPRPEMPSAARRGPARLASLTCGDSRQRSVVSELTCVLHFVPDADRPTAIVATLASGLAAGSFIALSHLTADFAPEQVTAAATAYNTQVPVRVTPRTHAEVTGLFGELPLVAPGVVPVTRWRPSVVGLPHRMTADLYSGLASIPGGQR